MTETISHGIDDKQRDGCSGRIGRVFDLAREKERAHGVILHAIGNSLVPRPPFCPP
jgi:hypothetical protein